MTKLVLASRDASESRQERKARLATARELLAVPKREKTSLLDAGGPFPLSKMPQEGWKRADNLRGDVRVNPPSHRASSKILAAAYPFLAESGETFRGAYVGDNMLSRSPFSMCPFEAWDDGIVKSQSVAIMGVKGTGKSILAKSWSTRLVRMGRCVAVPHDPNGEWARVAEYVGGKVIRVGVGVNAKINLLDAGSRDETMSDEEWRRHVLHERRSTVRTIVAQLRHEMDIADVEHTALDIALLELDQQTTVTVEHVFQTLRGLRAEERDVQEAATRLAHSLRRLVVGDLSGMFDGPSTVAFDPSAPMMVVDTSALKNASPEMQALSRLATARWVRNATSGSNRRERIIVHEEAAIALMNDVYGGAGLKDRVEDEKVARHSRTSNWYLIHRIADLDALGDSGSAMQTQALGLLADCDTRISYQQHAGEIARSRNVLGWNSTMSGLVRTLKKGEGLWQIGTDRLALVKNRLTPGELEVFRTDGAPR